MIDFLSALVDPNVPFLRYALIAGILSSGAFGVIGTYVVVRRISYMAGAISHSVLAGIGIVLFLRARHGLQWLTPLAGAVVAALLSALIIGLVSMYAREREDTVIGAIWALGMAVGVIFLARTPGYVDPMSYLFGNILIISRTDLFLIAALDLAVIGLGVLFYSQLQAIAFDEEFARVRGLNTVLYFMMMLLLTAVTVVMLVTIVGIVMVIALLTIPAAVSGLASRKLWHMMLLSALFCMVFTVAGLGVSYTFDLPSGATIIIIAGAAYVLALAVRRVVRGKSRS